MKVFLDIDGVMVHAIPSLAPKLMEDGFYEFNSEAIKALNILIMELGYPIELVLTTSHRFRYSLKEWRKLFKTRGIIKTPICRIETPQGERSRLVEIQDYIKLKHWEDEYILIIDDDKSFNGVNNINIIQTSPFYGLRVEDC